MDRLKELREKRAGLVAQAGAILDKADKENRGLSAEEEQQWDKLSAEIEQLGKDIVRRDTQQRTELELAASAGRQADLQMSGGSSRAARGELRFLQPAEKLTDYGRRDYKYEQFNLGKLCLVAAGENPANADLERRILSGSSDVAGGFLIPDTLSREIWDMARAKAVVVRGGAQTFEMPSANFRMPKLTKDPTGTWHSEGSEMTDVGVEFAALEMRARTLTFWIEISRELAQDAIGLDAALRNALAASAALELDRCALFGTGAAEQPMGLYSDVDVVKLPATAGAYWDDVSLSMKAIENANLTPSAVLMSPRTHHILRVLRDGEGRFVPAPMWSPLLLISKQISDTLGAGSNESIVVTGDFSHMLLGVLTEFRIELLKEAAAKKYAFVFLAGMRCDVAIVKGDAFHILSGLTTSWG